MNMTTPTSPFLEAARMFEYKLNPCRGCCGTLVEVHNIHEDTYSRFFGRHFHPSERNRVEYKVHGGWWLESKNQTPDQNRQDRIIALLLAHEIWCDENKLR